MRPYSETYPDEPSLDMFEHDGYKSNGKSRWKKVGKERFDGIPRK